MSEAKGCAIRCLTWVKDETSILLFSVFLGFVDLLFLLVDVGVEALVLVNMLNENLECFIYDLFIRKEDE